MKNKSRIPIFVALMLGAVLLLLASGAMAAPTSSAIVVTVTNDELNNDSDCSLREAIQAANTDQTVSGCSAGVGVDVINLASTLTGGTTYTLSLDSAPGSA